MRLVALLVFTMRWVASDRDGCDWLGQGQEYTDKNHPKGYRKIMIERTIELKHNEQDNSGQYAINPSVCMRPVITGSDTNDSRRDFKLVGKFLNGASDEELCIPEDGIYLLFYRIKTEWGDKERRVSFGSKPFEQRARLLLNGSVRFDDGHEWVQLTRSYDEPEWFSL